MGVTPAVHKPEGSAVGALVLTHGAGGNCETPLLIAVARAFADAGYFVLRYDLPFRQARKSGPPFPAQASADRNGLREAVNRMRDLTSLPVSLGGHSYGGRQSTILAAEDPSLVQSLLLLSYPLHPPNKPQQLRTEHFPRIQAPAVFVHGEKDAFGSADEMNAALSLLTIPHNLVLIPGAGHDLKRGRFDLRDKIVRPYEQISGRPAKLQ